MKKAVFAVALTAGLVAFGDDVATLEAGLKSDIMDKVNQVNPFDPRRASASTFRSR